MRVGPTHNMKERSATRSILLIDDDDLIAGSLLHYLSARGYAADLALDASHGEELMRAHAYGVILVDPYLTARVRNAEHDVIDMIRELQPRAAVIVLTAYASEPLLRLADEGRVSAVVAKPQPLLRLVEHIVHATPPIAKGFQR